MKRIINTRWVVFIRWGDSKVWQLWFWRRGFGLELGRYTLIVGPAQKDTFKTLQKVQG